MSGTLALLVGAIVSAVVVAGPPGARAAFGATPPTPPAAVDPTPYMSTVTTPGPTTIAAYSSLDNTVWSPQGSPYILEGPIDVDGTLTLLPGTVVKLATQDSDSITVTGGIYALGTPTQHVVITSLRDDTVDGDTNGDGSATTPAAGDWGALTIGYPESVGYFNYTDVRYGGNLEGSCQATGGEIEAHNDTRVVVSNSSVTHSCSSGLFSGQNAQGYLGVFNSTFDYEEQGGMTVGPGAAGPTVIVGNTFGAHLTEYSWYAQAVTKFNFNDNVANSPFHLDAYPSYQYIDTRFNSLLDGTGGGTYIDNWFGHNVNTESLPTCVTQAVLNTHIPQISTNYAQTCPTGTWPWSYVATVKPSLSSAPQAVPAAVYTAASAKYGPVDTSGGSLAYQTTDMVVQDASETLAAARTYNSAHTTGADAGPGWSTSYSEALSGAAGAQSMSLGDGSSVPFATDKAAGYTPAGGIDAAFTTGASGSTVSTADQTTYQFDTTGALTGMLLGDPGHKATVTRVSGKPSKITGVSGRYLSYTRTSGLVTKITDSQSRGVTMAYTSGRLTGVTGVDGKTEKYAYDSSGHLTTVTSPGGVVLLAATWDSSNRVASIQLPGKGKSTIAYDPTNDKTTITNADGSQVVQHYDTHGRLVNEQLVGGAASYVIYDGYGRQIINITGVPSTAMIGYQPAAQASLIDGHGDVVQSIDADRRAVAHTYDSAHRLLTDTYADGGVVARTYDANGRLTTVTDQLTKVWSYTYNSRGQVLTEKNPLAESRTFTYASNGDLVTMIDETGAKTTFTNDALGRPITAVDANLHTTTIAYTSWGDVSQSTTPSGKTTYYYYDADRELTSTVDPAGATIGYTYAAPNKISVKTDPLNQAETTTYDSVGHPTSITDVRGALSKLTYSVDGYVISSTDPSGAVTSMTNDPSGRPIRVTDAKGQVTQYTYDSSGQPTKIERPDGSVVSYTLDSVGRVASYTTALDNTWTNTYDKAGHVTVATDPLGHTQKATYDAIGRQITSTDQLARVTTATYNDTARTTTTTDTLGTKSILAYDPVGNLLKSTDGAGRSTSYGYNSDDLCTSVTDPANNKTGYAYDADGRLTAVTDPLGHTTSATLNASGEVTAVIDPNNNATKYTYEPGGEVSSVTDRTSGLTKYAYDPRGLETSVTDPLGKVTSTTYDSLGRPTKIVDPTGVEQDTAYTPTGQPAVLWDATGASTVRTYDLDGNLSEQTDPDGVVTDYDYTHRDELSEVEMGTFINETYEKYTYDAVGNLATTDRTLDPSEKYTYDQRGDVTSKVDEAGQTTSSTYDGAGNPLSTTTPSGNMSIWTYDTDGRMATAADSLGDTAHYAYNVDSQLATLTLPSGGAYTYAYDALGNIASQTDPDHYVTQYATDAEGRPTSTVTPAGRTITAKYDADGRVTQTGSGTQVRGFAYDDAGRPTATTVNGAADTSTTYNNRGLEATSKNSFGTTSYAYDAAAKLTTITPPTGTPTTFTYVPGGDVLDYGLGMLQSVSGPVTVTYKYNADDEVAGRTYGTGSTARDDTYAYGPDSEVTSRTVGATTPTTLTYTVDGQLATTTEPVTGSTDKLVSTYAYDKAGHLTSQNVVQGTTAVSAATYGWDKDGNRSSVQYGAATPITDTYDPADRLTTVSNGQTYAYDADGNRTTATSAAGTATYGYDAFDDLSSYTSGSSSVSYSYDALGRTAARTAGTSTQRFGYDDGSNDVATTDVNGGADTSMVYGAAGDTLAETTTGGVTLRPVTDPHGDVTSWQNNAAGAATATSAYDPFGVVGSSTGTAPPVALGFQGSPTDATSGLVDMGARSYDPQSADFTSVDDVAGTGGGPVTLNRYLYGNGDPVDNIDPDGHAAGSIFGAMSTIAKNLEKFIDSGYRNFPSSPSNDSSNGSDPSSTGIIQGTDFIPSPSNAGQTPPSHSSELKKGWDWLTGTAKQTVNYVENNWDHPGVVASDISSATQSITHTVTHAIATTSAAVGHWASKHADDIAQFAVSTAVFAGCEFVLGAPTGGAGAIVGAGACGALAGAVGGLTGQAVRCQEAQSGDSCDPDSFINAGLDGAVTGAIGGVVGGPVGGRAAALLKGAIGEDALSSGGGALLKIGIGALSGAAGGGAAGASIYGLTCNPNCSWSGLASSTGQGAAMGAAFGAVDGARSGGSDGSDDGQSGCKNSFDPNTQVLMANGTTKAIKDVVVGDSVVATDPVTGKTVDETVTDLHIDQDVDLTDLALATTPDGRAPPSVLHTTQQHPFWDATKSAWVYAGSLTVGDRLIGPNGQSDYVEAVRDFTGDQQMRNLTIDQLHTFYVLAGAASVLVHNCPTADSSGPSTDGPAPLTARPGTAEVSWDGGHATVTVSNGETSVTSDQQILGGAPRNHPTTGRQVSSSDTPSWAISVRFELADADAALRAQADTFGNDTGTFDFANNSCITYCANILKAGGYQIAGDPAQATSFLKGILTDEFERN